MITRHELTDLSYHLLSVTPRSKPNLTIYEENSTPYSKYAQILKSASYNFELNENEMRVSGKGFSQDELIQRRARKLKN